jgi:hypothetical protein
MPSKNEKTKTLSTQVLPRWGIHVPAIHDPALLVRLSGRRVPTGRLVQAAHPRRSVPGEPCVRLAAMNKPDRPGAGSPHARAGRNPAGVGCA